MEILGNQSYADYIPQYQGIPIDKVDDLGKTLETKYYANIDNAEKFREKMGAIKVEDRNNPILQKAVNHVNETFAQFDQNGNWESAHKVIRQSASEFANDATVKASIESKVVYDDWAKRMEDYMKDKDGNPEFAAYYRAKAAEDNASPITVDSKTGIIKGKFNGTIPQKDLGKEIIDEIDKLAGKWKPDVRTGTSVQMKDAKGNIVKRELMYKSGKDGTPPGYFDVISHEYINADEVRNSMMNRIMSDPRYSAYLNEAGKVDRWKQLKANGKTEIDVTDFYNPANPNAGLFKTEREYNDWAASITAAGYDITKFTQNPDIMAAYWQNYKKLERVKNLIEPTVQAISYDKEDHKYLEDWISKENLNFSHDMSKINARIKADVKLKQMEIDAKKAEKDQFVIKGSSPVEAEHNLSVAELQSQVNQKGQLLSIKQRDLDKMEKEDVKTPAYYQLKNEVAVLKGQADLQKATLTVKMAQVIDKPENASLVENLWNNVQKAQKSFGNDVVTSGALPKFFNSKQEFTTFIKENPEYLGAAEQSTLGVGHIGTNLGRMWYNVTAGGGNTTDKIVSGGFARGGDNKAQYIKNEIFGNTGHDLLNKAKDVKVGDINGWKYETYGGEFYDKKFNKQETDYARKNPSAYSVLGADGQVATLDRVLSEYDITDDEDDTKHHKFKMEVVRSNGDLSLNGTVRLPSKMTITDTKTGKVVKEMSIFQHGDDGGAGEMMQQGIQVIKAMPKGSNERYQGVQQYAKGRYANIITKDEERKWEGVDNIDVKSALNRATVTNVDGTSVKFIRVPYTTVDQNGTKNKEYLYHAAILDSRGNVTGLLPNSTNYDRPDVVDMNTGTSVYSAGFKSINDIKLELGKNDLIHKGIDIY